MTTTTLPNLAGVIKTTDIYKKMKFDYVANLVDMMDQVEVEASYADKALATHVNKMRVISAALEACASLLALRKQAHEVGAARGG